MSRLMPAILLVWMTITVTRVKAAAVCSDLQDMECRNQYVRANLPTIRPSVDANLRKKDQKTRLDNALSEIAAISTEMDKDVGQIQHAHRTEDYDAFAAAEKSYGADQKLLYAASNQAIALAIDLYELTPKIVDPSPGSQFKPWRPHYAEVDHKGNIVGTGGSFPAGGTSIYTGNLRIFPNAFADAQELKNAIYHETVHWLNDNALGRTPTPYEDFSNEIFAYEEQIRAYDALDLSYGQIQTLRGHETRYKGYLKRISKSETWEHLPFDIPGYQMTQALGADFPDAKGTPGIDADGNLRIDVDVEREIRRFEAAAKKYQPQDEIEAAHMANDQALRSALAGIIVRACTHSGSISQSELDSLPEMFDYSVFSTPLPEGITSGCRESAYRSLGELLSRGRRLTVADIQGALPREVPAAPAEDPTYALVRRSREVMDEQEAAAIRGRLISFLNGQVVGMQNIVRSACATNSVLSRDDVENFRSAYGNLIANSHSYDNRPTVDGYEPDTALQGLQSCDYDLMLALLRAPRQEMQYLNYAALRVLTKYHPLPKPVPVPYQRSRPEPRPDPCFVYDGVRFCSGR